LIAPLALYALYQLTYGLHDGARHDVADYRAALEHLPGYVWLGVRSAVAGTAGAPVQAGVVAVVALAALVGAVFWRRGSVPPRAVGAVTGLLSVYVFAGLVRAQMGVEQADQQRYTYAAAVFVLFLAAEALRELPWRGAWRIAIVTLAAMAVVANLRHLVEFSHVRRDLITVQKTELATLGALRGAPGMALDVPIDAKVFPPEVTPRRYFAATDALGAPVGSSSLAHLPPASVDRVVVGVFGPSVRVSRQRGYPPARDCERRFRGSPDVELPSGTTLVARSRDARNSSLFLWHRQNPDTDVSHELFFLTTPRLEQARDIPLRAGVPVRVVLPDLGHGLSWKVRWAGLSRSGTVCVVRVA
jgi:hypothetical protein